ncbi:trypsin-like serine protease [Ruegeria sp. SCSIO 43209]|uniref:trypsin-like serine peptidase n=1 Tax=Ruegeria sp. SCSIO 43209 TaxID=2793010 RepID=UPI001CA8284A|nr:trypsin-like serine protease [Ruegeria sp. SCSIO 43209]UAB87431.1 trypsin-like serine protease [Ruegeria sp. SCSIO 43209]
MRWLSVLGALIWAQTAQAQGQFTSVWEPICTMGRDTAAGCDEIRAREILDATTPPWRAIGRVNFASRSQRSHCTGVLVSERLVLTAAHCLYNSARNRWIPPASIRFAAGYQRGEAAAVSNVLAYRLDSEQGRDGVFNNRADLDWAVLELAEPIGEQVGFFDVSRTVPQMGTFAGYPGLRPHVLSRTDSCNAAQAGQGLMRAICPVMMGDSGAPFLTQTETGLAVAGILSRVAPTPDGIDALLLSINDLDLQ